MISAVHLALAPYGRKSLRSRPSASTKQKETLASFSYSAPRTCALESKSNRMPYFLLSMKPITKFQLKATENYTSINENMYKLFLIHFRTFRSNINQSKPPSGKKSKKIA